MSFLFYYNCNTKKCLLNVSTKYYIQLFAYVRKMLSSKKLATLCMFPKILCTYLCTYNLDDYNCPFFKCYSLFKYIAKYWVTEGSNMELSMYLVLGLWGGFGGLQGPLGVFRGSFRGPWGDCHRLHWGLLAVSKEILLPSTKQKQYNKLIMQIAGKYVGSNFVYFCMSTVKL